MDLGGNHERRQPIGDEAPQILRAGVGPRLQDHVGVGHLARDRVGNPDHTDLPNRRVVGESLLHLEGPNGGFMA